jgi:hypothetical protein
MTDQSTLRTFAAAVETLPATKPGISDEARQAIIEHNRTMKDVRRFQTENRERIDAEWAALSSPPRTIAEHVASLSPERRAELEREWK